jgi:folate-binding protein YgfZ
VAHLDRYVIREDVQLRDTTDERGYLLASGGVPAEGSYTSMSWDIVGRAEAKLIEFAWSEGEALGRIFSQEQPVLVHRKAFTAARIEAGFPLMGVDFGEENLPQEVGRDREAISFTKGCYLGQETVARIDALGHVNQRIVGVRISGSDVPARGTELTLQGKNVGLVTSAAFSPKLVAPLAIAMVRREANSSGARLGSSIGECEVVALPLAQ